MSTGTRKPPFESAADRTGTGLDYLRRIAACEIANVPIGDTLGFRIVEVEHGRIVLTGAPDRRSYNLIGTVHGGWAAAILDSALALATLASLDAHHGFTTVDFKLNFLRPITADTGEVRAEGRVLHGGRRIALGEAKLSDRGGKLLVHATGTCLIIPRQPERAG